jgi:hypothetical protein
MDLRKLDAFSDWDDWSDDGPEWWLRHPLHHPKPKSMPSREPHPRGTKLRKGKNSTLA